MKRLTLITLIVVVSSSCIEEETLKFRDIEPRQEMRNFVIGISDYSKALNSSFVVIPQNGIELISTNGEEDGELNSPYLRAIDGHGQEDLNYGFDFDDQLSPQAESGYLKIFLNRSKNSGNTILVTDYCSTPAKMDDSYSKNSASNFISFAANERELNKIPSYPNIAFNENSNIISKLSDAKNFLYLINPSKFDTKADFISAVTSTNYDLLIMDLFFNDNSSFTKDEIEQLRSKSNGGKRMVISYISIGEAEDYRYYWLEDWNTNRPIWLDRVNPGWPGNFKVRYWNQEWQSIIYGNDSSYLKKIADAGFDGVYLDIVDAYEFFE